MLKFSGDSLIYGKDLFTKDTKTKTLVLVLNANIDGKILKLSESNTGIFGYDFKKIDETILENIEDIPFNKLVNCNEFEARQYLVNNLNHSLVDCSFSFLMNSIKLISIDNENCIYTYSGLYQSKEFSDINADKEIRVSFNNEGKINIEFYNR